MDRRSFLNTVLVSPVVTSVLLATKQARKHSELYLIADNPQEIIPAVLQELSAYGCSPGRRFSFLTLHPQQEFLTKALQRLGHIPHPEPQQADMTISFSLLQQPARPSFTLIENGRIRDVRTRTLRDLWTALNRQFPATSGLTIFGFSRARAKAPQGRTVAMFQNGQQTKMFPLSGQRTEVFAARQGNLTLRIKDDRAWISESSCRHQVCRLSPPISLTGERIICAPNHVLLEVQGGGGVDTVIG
jgi:hypothetical protein